MINKTHFILMDKNNSYKIFFKEKKENNSEILKCTFSELRGKSI